MGQEVFLTLMTRLSAMAGGTPGAVAAGLTNGVAFRLRGKQPPRLPESFSFCFLLPSLSGHGALLLHRLVFFPFQFFGGWWQQH